jgi:hypothetical protein
MSQVLFHKMSLIYFLIYILKFKTQILNTNCTSYEFLIFIVARYILLKFYDFWSQFDTRSNENKINV